VEYTYIDDEEEGREAVNTLNELKFPVFLNVEDNLERRNLSFKQKWKIKNYLLQNVNQYKILLSFVAEDWKLADIKYLDLSELYFNAHSLFYLNFYLFKVLVMEQNPEANKKVANAKLMMIFFINHLTYFLCRNEGIWSQFSLVQKIILFIFKKRIAFWENKIKTKIKILRRKNKFFRNHPRFQKLWEDGKKMYSDFVGKYMLPRKLLKLIPFTFLLYCKYNLGILWVGTFLTYYFYIRMTKVGIKWFYLIWKSFYSCFYPYGVAKNCE
jgi:hypothetical protein